MLGRLARAGPRSYIGQVKPRPGSGLPRINWQHPLADALQFYAYDMPELGGVVDLVSGAIATSNLANTATPFGPAALYAGTARSFSTSQVQGYIRTTTGNGNYSWGCAYYKTGTAAAYAAPMGRNANSGSSQPFNNWDWELNPGSAGQTLIRATVNNAGVQTTSSNLTVADNAFTTVIGILTGTGSTATMTHNVNGAAVGGSEFNITPNNNNVGDVINIGGIPGAVYWAGFWARPLSADECALLHRDPYCFLVFDADLLPAIGFGYTSWNPADKSASTTLSNNNRAAASALSAVGVRAIDQQTNTKVYWEYTFNTVAVSSTQVGVGNDSAIFTSAPSSVLTAGNSIGLSSASTGSVQKNGVAVATSLGAITAGTLGCIALDTTATTANPNGQVWFRVGAAGNWNGSASANPATGVGGIPLWGPGIPVYPMAWLGQTSDQVTANFGNSAFTGSVPSGFTSGFLANVSAPAVNVINTQAAVEEWGSGTPTAQLTQAAIEEWGVTDPPMQLTQIAAEHWAAGQPAMALTQVAIEHWAQVSSVTVAMALTQVAVEHWASVLAASTASTQPIITIIN